MLRWTAMARNDHIRDGKVLFMRKLRRLNVLLEVQYYKKEKHQSTDRIVHGLGNDYPEEVL